MEKAGRDPLYIKNWCPLSLLSCVLAKLISVRIQDPLQQVIHKEQHGFLQGRLIGENLLDLLSVIEHCAKNKIDALLISFDFEKAFDKVEWEILYDILERFNFGPTIRQMIHTLYKDTQSCVINNGTTSDWFKISRSVRQGCPLSASLFYVWLKSWD